MTAVSGTVVVSGYDEVSTVLRAPGWSSDPRRFADAPVEARDIPPYFLILMDPPDHTELRRLLRPAFTRRAIEQIRPRIAAIAEAALAGLDPEVDLIEDYAEVIPIAVMAELLDVGPEGAEIFHTHTAALVKILEADSTAADLSASIDAAFELAMFLTPLIVERKDQRGNDFISALLAQGDITIDEVLSVCILLLAAGQDSTASTIGNSALALMQQSDQLVHLFGEPTRAVEELLRTSGSIRLLKRAALIDHRVGDLDIAAGTTVVLDLHGASTDPRRYPDPLRMDLSREFRGHLAFGKGPHVCLGAALARIQLGEALTRLFRTYPDVHPTTAHAEWRPSASVHSLVRLPVRLR